MDFQDFRNLLEILKDNSFSTTDGGTSVFGKFGKLIITDGKYGTSVSGKLGK